MVDDPSAAAQASLFPPELPDLPDRPRPEYAEAWAENSLRQQAAHAAEDRAARDLEHRRILRGTLLIGVVVLLASISHAGLARAFYPGWWRQW